MTATTKNVDVRDHILPTTLGKQGKMHKSLNLSIETAAAAAAAVAAAAAAVAVVQGGGLCDEKKKEERRRNDAEWKRKDEELKDENETEN